MSSNSLNDFSYEFTPNWDSPDANTKVLFAAVGSAISSWKIVEAELSRVYVCAAYFGGRAPAGAIASFSSITSFDARVKMLAELLVHTFKINDEEQNDLLTSWFALAAKCQSKASGRNELAHGAVMSQSDPDGTLTGPFWIPYLNHSRLILEAAGRDYFHERTRHIARMRLADIKNRDDSFKRLFEALLEFRTVSLLPLVHRLTRISEPDLKQAKTNQATPSKADPKQNEPTEE